MADFRYFTDKTKSYTKDELEKAKILDDQLQFIEDTDNPGNYKYVGTTGELMQKILDGDTVGFDVVDGIFGDRLTATRVPKFSANFSYPLSTKGTSSLLVGTGAVGLNNNKLQIKTGATAGSSATIRSKGYLRYTAGRDAEMMFTAIFTAGVAGTKQYAGLFDTEDGFFLGFEGADFMVGRRSDLEGSDEIITQQNFNGDKLDGTGDSGFVLDPTKINIYRITYGYLGTAPILYQISVPYGKGSRWVTFHTIDRRNKFSDASIRIPYLPVAAYVENGVIAQDIIMESASIYAGVFDGHGKDDRAARYFSARVPLTAFTTGDNQLLAIFHNKDTFQGFANHIESLLNYFDGAVEGNKPVQIDLYKLANQARDDVTYNWEDVDTDNSTFEFSLDQPITDLPNSELMMSFSLGKSDSIQMLIPDFLNIQLFPNEYAGFVVSSGGATEVIAAIRWKEMF